MFWKNENIYVTMRQTFCVKISELRVYTMDKVYAVRIYFI